MADFDKKQEMLWRSGKYSATPEQARALMAEIDRLRKANNTLERNKNSEIKRLKRQSRNIQLSEDVLQQQAEYERWQQERGELNAHGESVGEEGSGQEEA